jgi:hypothetical protein
MAVKPPPYMWGGCRRRSVRNILKILLAAAEYKQDIFSMRIVPYLVAGVVLQKLRRHKNIIKAV